MDRVIAFRIRALRALERSPDSSWVRWAEDALTSGMDAPAILEMACLRPPLHYFEVVEVTDRALAEAGFGPVPFEEALATYSAAVLTEALEKEGMSRALLKDLADIYMESGMLPDLEPFYLLYHAWIDLESTGTQRYWTGADVSNIEDVSLREARRFLACRAAL